MIFGSMDGGVFLYSRAAMANGNTDMSAALSAKGRDADADTYAIGVFRAKGITGSAILTINEIDFTRAVLSSSGALTPDSTCGGGSQLCQNTYLVDGSTKSGGLQNWPPSNRVVSAGVSDFAQVTIKYDYKPIFFRAFALTVTVSRYIRLEPQT